MAKFSVLLLGIGNRIMTTKRQTDPVSSDDARRYYRIIAAILEPLGYFVGWYGSTTYGSGADVDILAIPKQPNPENVLSTLQKLGTVEDIGYYQPARFHNYLLTLEDKSIDIHVFSYPDQMTTPTSRWEIHRADGTIEDITHLVSGNGKQFTTFRDFTISSGDTIWHITSETKL